MLACLRLSPCASACFSGAHLERHGKMSSCLQHTRTRTCHFALGAPLTTDFWRPNEVPGGARAPDGASATGTQLCARALHWTKRLVLARAIITRRRRRRYNHAYSATITNLPATWPRAQCRARARVSQKCNALWRRQRQTRCDAQI